MAQGPARGTVIPRLLKPLDRVRALVSRLGLHQVGVVKHSWLWTDANGRHKVGTGVRSPLPDVQIGNIDARGILQNPHVDATAGGSEATFRVTPAYFDQAGLRLGGYTVDELNPLDSGGLEVVYTIEWPQGPRDYVVAPRGLSTDRSMRYVVHLVSTDQRVPF